MRLSVSQTPSNTSTNTPTLTPSLTPCPYTCCFPSGFTTDTLFVSNMFLPDSNTVLLGGAGLGSYQGNIDFTAQILRLNACGSFQQFYSSPTPGISSGAGGFVKQSNGKIIVAGNNSLWRLNADYSVDTTFTSGLTAANTAIRGVNINSLDEILIVGNFNSNYTTSAGTVSFNTNIYKLSPNGVPDTSYSGKSLTWIDPGVEPFDNQIKKDPNGKLMIDGFNAVNGNTNYAGIVRFNNDFSFDTTFQAAGFIGAGRFVFTSRPLSNGQYLVGGAFDNYSGFTNQDFLIRLNNDGTLDTTFDFGNSITNQYVYSIVVQSTGKIIVADSGANVIRLNSNGSVDNTFISGSTTTTGVYNETSLMLFPNDAILVGGAFNTYNGLAYPKLVKLDEDGALNMCPLPTPSPTATNTSTPTLTPTLTPTNTSTPTLTPTNTSTITPTPSSTQLCQDNFTLTQTAGSPVNIQQGAYNRITSFTGGTFSFGFFSGSPVQFITGTAPNGRNYLVYQRQVGSFFTNIGFNYAALGTPPSVNVWRGITTTGTSIVNGASFGSISGNVVLASASTIYNGAYIPPFSETIAGRGWNFAYGAVCPTATPTITATQTSTPSQTPSQTTTQTNTPTPSSTIGSTPTNTASQTQTPSATPTLTPSITPSQTATQTNTPSQTQTNTPSVSPTCECYTYTNNSGVNWLGDWVDCDGTNHFAEIVLPGNSICAKPTPFTLTGVDLTQGFSCCIDVTPSNTPTNTVTQTQTPSQTQTNTPTPSITPTKVNETCAFLTVRTDASLDIPITGVEVNSVPVSYLSGTTFPIDPFDAPGYYNTTTTGTSQTVTINYGSNIPGQRIVMIDCSFTSFCCDLNPGGGTCTFTGVNLSCGCNWNIDGYDGTC